MCPIRRIIIIAATSSEEAKGANHGHQINKLFHFSSLFCVLINNYCIVSIYNNNVRVPLYYILLQLVRDTYAAVDRIHRLLDGLEIFLEDTI